MKFGIGALQFGAPGDDGSAITSVAGLAEDLGFESLWAAEHIVIPEKITSVYPGGGPFAGDPLVSRPDPLLWLSYAAAITTTIKLGTGVLLLPLRNPVLLAKEAATLDRISGGRLLLGVGLGWMREEYDAVGVDWADRGRRFEEHVAVLRTLWQPGPNDFAGRFVTFSGVHSSPPPCQPTIPVIVAGSSERAAARAGRIGDGYFPMAVTPERASALIGIARDEAVACGRDADALEITFLGPADLGFIEALRPTGVDRYIVFDRPQNFADRPSALTELAAALGISPKTL